MTNKTLKIKGMHCASCATIITNKVSKLGGVDAVSVNFATEKANVSFDDAVVSIHQMNNEVEKLGYTYWNQRIKRRKNERASCYEDKNSVCTTDCSSCLYFDDVGYRSKIIYFSSKSSVTDVHFQHHLYGTC